MTAAARYTSERADGFRTVVDVADDGSARWTCTTPDVAGSRLVRGTGTLPAGYDELELEQAVEAVRMAADLDPEPHR